MKKWLTLCLAAALAMSLTVLPALAAEMTWEDVLDGEYTVYEPTEGRYTVTFEHEDLAEDSVALIIVIKGLWSSASDIELDAANPNICYIYDATVTTEGEVTFDGEGDGFGLMMSPDATVVISGGGLENPVIAGYIEAVGAPVSGTVNFIGGSGRVATVKLTDSTDDSIVFETTVTGSGASADDYDFSFDAIPEGTYYFTAECEGHCAYEQSAKVTVTAEGVENLEGTLRPGDCNGDNVIGYEDLALIIAPTSYGKSVTEAADAGADVNGDGVIGYEDLALVISPVNYGEGSYTE